MELPPVAEDAIGDKDDGAKQPPPLSVSPFLPQKDNNKCDNNLQIYVLIPRLSEQRGWMMTGVMCDDDDAAVGGGGSPLGLSVKNILNRAIIVNLKFIQIPLNEFVIN